MSKIDPIVSDLDVNHSSWRQENDDLVRSLCQYNSTKIVTVKNNGKIEIMLRGEHKADHKLKPSFFERMKIKRASRIAKDRIIDGVLGQLGKKEEPKA